MGSLDTRAGIVPQVSWRLTHGDQWGAFKVRWDIHRMDYKVDPGLYALGHPNDNSPVLVTANYKLSFDRLREAMPERNVWILALDTDGINVWCAAGKGTFGTEELVRRVESSGLARIVSHRELILPQLSAPGVAAHLVKKLSGFKVIYGPIRSKDLPAFLDNGLKATPEMRMKTFNTRERAVLIPVELVEVIKPALLAMAGLFLLGAHVGPGSFWASAFTHGLFAVFCLLAALLAGAVLTPLLLPWLPGRAFSLKGLTMGLVTVVILSLFRWDALAAWHGRFEMMGWVFLVPAIAAYLAMNFTGASTYTSLSGVKKEMRWAVPMQISGAVVGLGLWLGSRFVI
jgi:acetyl-CoA decarbonylase/synthase complex subunit gamma